MTPFRAIRALILGLCLFVPGQREAAGQIPSVFRENAVMTVGWSTFIGSGYGWGLPALVSTGIWLSRDSDWPDKGTDWMKWGFVAGTAAGLLFGAVNAASRPFMKPAPADSLAILVLSPLLGYSTSTLTCIAGWIVADNPSGDFPGAGCGIWMAVGAVTGLAVGIYQTLVRSPLPQNDVGNDGRAFHVSLVPQLYLHPESPRPGVSLVRVTFRRP